jgi:glycosyltransferase involved in cell wall biosynthesis
VTPDAPDGAPTISVITVTLNAGRTLDRTLASVAAQRSPPEECIVVDGGSTDATLDIARARGDVVSRIVSERDEGIFDAMNRGLALARGDVVGFLNADDVFAHDRVLASVRKVLADRDLDACYGDLDVVNARGRVIRRWRSSSYARSLLDAGWVPPHPTFYCRREVLVQAGGFRKGYGLAGDYELFVRLFAIRRIRTRHIPEVLVRMESGGASNGSLSKVFRGTREVSRAWRENGLTPPPLVALRKLTSKGLQLWRSP